MIYDVLSLFDGCSTGQVALQRAGVKYRFYYASEINKYAIKVARYNYPGTIFCGDVTKLRVDKLPTIPTLLIGGSPCQKLSVAGDQSGFEGESELFWQYVRVLKELRKLNPDVKFLFENVIPAKRAWRHIITLALGVTPVEIDASLVSAQSRRRLYWTNIEGIEQPADRGIALETILLPLYTINTTQILSDKAITYMNRGVKGGRTHWDFNHHSDTQYSKSACVVYNFHKGAPYNVLIDRRGTDVLLRSFAPIEVERLQSLPDNYTAAPGVYNSRRYEMIGNGWNSAVIEHIFSYLDN